MDIQKPVEWSDISYRDQWRLITTMPSIIGPWVPLGKTGDWVRQSCTTRNWVEAGFVEALKSGFKAKVYGGSAKKCKTLREAMEYIDTMLQGYKIPMIGGIPEEGG